MTAPQPRLRGNSSLMLESTSRRSGLIAAALAALVVLVVAAVAVIYDQSRKDQLAPGLKVDGVAVGGLDTTAARAKLERLAVTPRHRALTIHAADTTITVPPQRLHVKVDLDAVVDRALAISRRGWIGARVVRGVTGKRTERDLPLQARAAPGVLGRVAVGVAKQADRAPKDASVDPRADGLDVKAAEPGRAVDAAGLRSAMRVAISDPRRPADITATMKPIAPKVTRADLAKSTRATSSSTASPTSCASIATSSSPRRIRSRSARRAGDTRRALRRAVEAGQPSWCVRTARGRATSPARRSRRGRTTRSRRAGWPSTAARGSTASTRANTARSARRVARLRPHADPRRDRALQQTPVHTPVYVA